MAVGYPFGWSLSFGSGSSATTCTQASLFQSKETLAHFCRRFKRQARIALRFDAGEPPVSLPPLLPWIAFEGNTGGPSGHSRSANQEAIRSRGKKSSSRRQGIPGHGSYARSCALSAFSERWEAAHLVPHHLSGPHFTRNVADENLQDLATEYTPRQKFSTMIDAIHEHLVGPDQPGYLQDFADACERVGEDFHELATTTQGVCAALSCEGAKSVFADLSADWDREVFFLAWPLMLSRERIAL